MRFTTIFPVLLLAGCMTAELAPPPAPPNADACGAASLQGLVGQSRSVLDRMSLPKQTRIIGPNQAVTMDLRPDRLNIEYDKHEKISRISCF